jgi:hypothetical protein
LFMYFGFGLMFLSVEVVRVGVIHI